MQLPLPVKKAVRAVIFFQLLLLAIVAADQISRPRNYTQLKAWGKLVPVSIAAFSASDPGIRFPLLRSREHDRLDVLRDSDPLLFVFKYGAKK